MSELNSVNTSGPRRKFLTRDQCIEIRALRRIGNLSIRDIAIALNASERQVRFACNRPDENPGTSSGRPPTLSIQQVDELEAYIQSSPAARRMSYIGLCDGPFSHWNCGPKAIRRALQRRGYKRCLVRSRSQPENRVRGGQWETRRLGNARGTGMTGIDTERGGQWETRRLGNSREIEIMDVDTDRNDSDRRGIQSREGAGIIANGGVIGESCPREGPHGNNWPREGLPGVNWPREGLPGVNWPREGVPGGYWPREGLNGNSWPRERLNGNGWPREGTDRISRGNGDIEQKNQTIKIEER